jgi:hypothetical protein
MLVTSRLEGNFPQVFNILSLAVEAGLVRAHETIKYAIATGRLDSEVERTAL